MGGILNGCRIGVEMGRSRGFSVVFLVCGVLTVAPARMSDAAVVNWTKGEGDWATPSNWSSNPLLPGPGDDALNPLSSRITHGTGDHTVKSFASTGPFTLSGGSISAATSGVGSFRVDSGFGFTVTGGTLRGFRLVPGAAGRPVVFDAGGLKTLDNITSDADLELGFPSVPAGTVVLVNNGLTLNGTASVFNSLMAFQGNQTLGGSGAVVFGGGGPAQRVSVEGDTTLTIGPNMEIHGFSGNVGRWVNIPGGGKLVNQGRIYSDGPGGAITIDPASPALNSVTNSGILEAGINATLNLNSHVTNTQTGQIKAGQFGRVFQNGVEITGGTINLDFDSTLVPSASSANFLNGVKLNGNMDLATAHARQVIRNGLSLGGTVRIDSNSVLSFNGTQTLSGPPTFGPSSIVFGTAPDSRLELSGGAFLTLANNVSIFGNNGRIGSTGVGGGQGIENLGSIAANVEGGTLHIESPTLTNRGNLQATQGGTLALTGGTVNNSGNIFASAGGIVNLSGGVVTNTGNIEARAGGTINFNTNVTNTGFGNITVAAPDGRINVNGVRITGERINNTQGGTFRFSNSQNNVLEDVFATGNFLLDGGTLRFLNLVTLDGSLDISGGGTLAFPGNKRLSETAFITLKPGPVENRVVIEGTSTFRVAPGAIIVGPGFIGESTTAPGTTTLFNEGTISSSSPGNGTLTVRVDAFTNAQSGRISSTFLPLNVETNGPVINQGLIETAWGNMSFNQDVIQTAGKTELGFSRVDLAAGKVFRLSGGTLGGVGGIGGDVINDHGTVILGPFIAFSLGIQGSYTQGPDGRLESALANTIDDPQQLRISGAATLDGTLSILRAGGFVPTPYKRYRIMSYASRSGTFDQYDGTSAGNGLVFATDYLPDGLDLVPAVLGDANLDRAVGFADLVAIAQNYNTLDGSAFWRRGDFTFDGNVNFADLVILAQRYNTNLPADVPGARAAFREDWAVAVAQVPEPAGLLVLTGLLVLSSRRRFARSIDH